MKKHFEIFDKFYRAHWFLTGFSCRNFSELLRAGGNNSLSTFVGVMEKDVNSMIFYSDEFDQAANYYADKLINNQAWRKAEYKKHDNALKKYFLAGEKFRKLPFKKMSNREIVLVAEPLIKLQEQVRILGVMLNGLVIDGRGHLSDKIRNELLGYFAHDKDFDTHWSVLSQTSRLSMRQKKEIAIAKLAEERAQTFQKKDKILNNLHESYCWLDYMYYGPPASLKSFVLELAEAKKHNSKLQLAKQLNELANKQERIIRKFKLKARTRHLIKLAQHVLLQKSWRKDMEYHGFYCYEPMFREIAERKGEKDWRNLLYMLPWELENFILHNKPSLKELKSRRLFSCLIVKGPKNIQMLTGVRAKEFYKKLNIEQVVKQAGQAHGQCAYAGHVKGKVKIIYVPDDMAKMKKGDILISQATSPDLLPAMKKAAAIVTNTGGLICHAAITSRELKIPCIVGTANATLIFKDGDRVDVDATNGIIKKI